MKRRAGHIPAPAQPPMGSFAIAIPAALVQIAICTEDLRARDLNRNPLFAARRRACPYPGNATWTTGSRLPVPGLYSKGSDKLHDLYRMLERLAEIASDHRIATFDAYVLQDNQKMMQVFLDCGFEVRQRKVCARSTFGCASIGSRSRRPRAGSPTDVGSRT